MLDRELSDTIETIYEAALTPERWYDTLVAVVKYVGAERGMVGMTNATTGLLDVSEMYALDADLMALWATKFGGEDPWADGIAGVVAGDVGRGSDLISYEELEKKQVFREIVVPVGVYDTCYTAIASNRLRVGFLSVYQGEELGRFSDETVERMAVLGPHLVRAAKIHTHLSELRVTTAALGGALDELSFALVTCTRDGRIVTANRPAEALFGKSGVLKLRDQRLSTWDPSSTQRLWDLIERASDSGDPAMIDSGVVALVRPGFDDRPLSATVVPISRRVDRPPWAGDSATALVVITSPEQPLDVPEGALSELYSLTPAEARLALAVAHGQSPADYAELEGIAVSTARWTLKKVQAKTGTNTQSALAALIMRSLGPLARAR